MRKPIWLRRDVVQAIHQRQLAEHGGEDGLRDEGLLESALARPLNLWAYGDPKPDLAALAAAYAFGLTRNHPFVDGNKRVAYVACRTFLLLNNNDVDAAVEQKFLIMMRLASAEVDEQAFAAWLRGCLRKNV